MKNKILSKDYLNLNSVQSYIFSIRNVGVDVFEVSRSLLGVVPHVDPIIGSRPISNLDVTNSSCTRNSKSKY